MEAVDALQSGLDEDLGDAVADFDYRNQKDAVLFCIDTSPAMLTQFPSSNDDSSAPPTCAARVALESAYRALLNRIISQPHDGVGVMLFGTRDRTDPAFDNCLVLMPLDVPDVNTIRRLRDILEDEDEFDRIFTPSDTPTQISTVLFAASQQFTTKLQKFIFRRIFLITNNDNPATSAADRRAARTRAKDLIELGIRIEPFFLAKSKTSPFDTSLFYEDLLQFSIGDSGDGAASNVDVQPISSMQTLEMQSHIRARQTPRHAIFSVPMEIAPGKVTIGVKGYVLYSRRTIAKSAYVYMQEGEKPQIAHSRAEYVKLPKEDLQHQQLQSRFPNNVSIRATAEDNGTAASNDTNEEFARGYQFGGEILPFTAEERNALRDFGKPGIQILGFKPLRMLDPRMTCRAAVFIYPSEEEYVGSVRTFAALHKVLLSDKKFAVSWIKGTANSSPALYNLVAAEEIIEKREGGRDEQVQAPGLYAIRVPFLDDVRDYPVTAMTDSLDEVKAPSDLIEAAKFIKNLEMPRGYEPLRYPNPALQWHYRILQAVAFEEELPEKPDDFTLPKYKSIQNRTGKHMQVWQQLAKEEAKRRRIGTAPRRILKD
ncbi:SPOC like C-terminal domain-containing protein [Limtongia smithiae]|uniref:SPOC like C-terminal domain-containing protein n=1 Tax=Limtongia smithiae TaxID=1125753 RepID=UPI0034CDEA52